MNFEETRRRGAKLIEQMMGPDGAERTRQAWRDICPDFEEYVVRFLAGEVWSRPGLDLRTRSLVTIAALAALGRTLGLDLNIRMALNNGATRQEVVETLLHLAPYAGFPACWEGLALAHKVFAEQAPPAAGPARRAAQGKAKRSRRGRQG
jgi:4-carboxymuconolactone decarboxylase